jgi:hypothetical protein
MICGKLSVLRPILSANVRYNSNSHGVGAECFGDIRKDMFTFLFSITVLVNIVCCAVFCLFISQILYLFL